MAFAPWGAAELWVFEVVIAMSRRPVVSPSGKLLHMLQMALLCMTNILLSDASFSKLPLRGAPSPPLALCRVCSNASASSGVKKKAKPLANASNPEPNP